MLREPLTLTSTDGLRLEGELATPAEPWAGAVLAHPNPRDGGNMRSMVPGELIEALPALGVATLRFNFRGVGSSEGMMQDGAGEGHDVVGAVGALHEIVEGLPLIVVGSSFGANVALTVDDERISGWCGCAPTFPDHLINQMTAVAGDHRPKLLILAARDQLRDAATAQSLVAGWNNTSTQVIPGADHFFIGRIELVVRAVETFVLGFR